MNEKHILKYLSTSETQPCAEVIDGLGSEASSSQSSQGKQPWVVPITDCAFRVKKKITN
jgi:hypothetical protein